MMEGMSSAAPQRLGRYEVGEKLGQGGMGSVYKGRDPVLDRSVAIKTLGGAFGIPAEQRAEFLERFSREARAAGRLSHPNIVAVHDTGVDETSQTPFIVMEYVPGVSLATVLKENPALPVAQALEIVEQVGAALEEAHRRGVVHRDVKPANVFLDERGRVKVGDFGIARLEDSDLTQAGVGLGTPGYIAPEVLRGGRAEARSDLFALGVLAYALLAGRRPFSGDTREALAIQVLELTPPPLVAARSDVPLPASNAVMRALSKSPAGRQASVAAFLAELRGAAPDRRVEPTRTVDGALVSARPATASPAARTPRLVVTAVLLLLLMGSLLGLFAWRRQDLQVAAPPVPLRATPRPTPRAAGATPTGIRIEIPLTLPKEFPKITLPGQNKESDPKRDRGKNRKKDKD